VYKQTVRVETNINKPCRRKITQRQAARVLHVSHEHLNRVIHGKEKSPRLLALYNELISQQTKPTIPSTHEKNN
jgi:hypothetical protein